MKRFFLLTILIFLSSAQAVYAQFEPLVGIPGLTDNGDIGIAGYVNRVLVLAITFGGLLAVVRISIAGFKYMFTDIVSSKQSAKDDIRGAFIGLGILLGGAIILFTINPDIKNLDVFKDAEKIKLEGGEFSKRGTSYVVVPPSETFNSEEEAAERAKTMECPEGHRAVANGKTVTCKDTHGKKYSGLIRVPEPSDNWISLSTAERKELIDKRAGVAISLYKNCLKVTGYKAEVEKVGGETSVNWMPGSGSSQYSVGQLVGPGWRVTCSLREKDD